MSEVIENAEKATPRVKEVIQKDCDEAILQAGRFSYTIACMKQDLDRLYSKIYALGQELKESEKDSAPAPLTSVPHPMEGSPV